MAVPKRRTSKSRQGKRRSHQGIPAIQYITCPNCGAARLPHRVCPECGYYNGNPVITPEGE